MRYSKIYALLLAAMLTAGSVSTATAQLAPTSGPTLGPTSGPTIHGNVYGGGNAADVNVNATVNITGGQIGGSTVNADHGNVFGGGKGQNTTVKGNVSVNIGKVPEGSETTYTGTGTVKGSVYGGSALGYVNANTTKGTDGTVTAHTANTDKTTQVNVFKGTVKENVYGGGRGDADNSIAAMSASAVTVTIGANATEATPTIDGSVYGGSDANGVLESNVRVDVIRGTLGKTESEVTTGGNVHGGGYGQPTLVKGSVEVNIGERTGTSPDYAYSGSATIKGDVYGGSAMGNVNAHNTSTDPAVTTLERYNSAETKVNLYGCTSVNNIYGGGLGDNTSGSEVAANVYGPVTVTVEGGTAQNVFGCNNKYGTPKGTVVVLVNGTNATAVDAQTSAKTYAIKGVYGGGNLAHYDPTTPSTYPTVTVNGCFTSIEDVFGGGNAAAVPYTSVTINGGDIKRVFAGGNGSSAAANVGYKNNEDVPETGTDEYGAGSANVTIAGGTINQVFGGSNSKGTVRTSGIFSIAKPTSGDNLCDMKIGEVYGGGNLAAGVASTITIGCTGSIVDGENGHEAHPENIGTTLEGIGSVYGGANQADVSGDISLSINSGIIANVFGGNNTSGDIYGKITVNINKTSDACGWYVGNVYGGGNQATYSVENIDKNRADLDFSTASADNYYKNYPKVNILAGDVSGDVYGGGLGNVADASKGVVTGNPIVTLTNGSVRNIYGGGSAASIEGSTLVKVEGGSVTADVYGGGEGSTTNVTGSVEVRIGKNESGTYSGTATIGGDVYGGSAFGKVNDDGTTTPTGTTSVNLYAGNITGKVFGGGKGVASTPAIGTTPADPGVEAEVYGATTVKLYGDVVTGGIYGGCNLNGAMKGNTQLDLLGGTVGVSGLSTTPDIVFGGGLGPDTKVNGNVIVNIGDADNAGTTIYSNVYGGSAMGTVNSSTSNTTTVNLFKGTVYGNVFGGGLGDADNPAGVKGNVFVKLNENDGTCVVTGSIFGCNNTNGSPEGHVTVHVYKTAPRPGQGEGDYDLAAVYGGGNNADYEPTDTKLFAEVIIEGCTNTSIQNVYGGGNAAAVPATEVWILGATKIFEVFGGGNGEAGAAYAAHVGYHRTSATAKTDYASGSGKTYVKLVGGTINTVYGGSNSNGDIRDGSDISMPTVDEYKATHTDTPNCCSTLTTTNIYGGGKNADMSGSTTIKLGCVEGLNNVFGGAKAANIKGGVNLVITGGTFANVFGGNDTSGTIQGPIKLYIEESCAALNITNLYLGGNLAPYSVYGYYNAGTDDAPDYRPRTSKDDINPVATGTTAPPTDTKQYADPELYVTKFTKIDNVFGGGYGSTAVMYGSPTMYINEVPNIAGNIGEVGNVFGGGNEASVIGNTTVNIGTETSVYMKTDETNHDVKGVNITGNVYGGGNLADITGNTQVNICAEYDATNDVYNAVAEGSEKVTIAGDVFGAGKGVGSDVTKALVEGNSTIVMKGGSVKQSVYGGGELSQVEGNTDITVAGGTIGTPNDDTHVYGGATYGNIYGGGQGNTTTPDAGLIKGNTKITVQNTVVDANTTLTPTILHNVYGGGAYGSVGTITRDAAGATYVPGRTANILNMPTAWARKSGDTGTDTGNTEIYINGGQIGTNGNENGMVFGSSRGDVATPDGADADNPYGIDVDENDRLAWVYDTKVVIGQSGSPDIRGSVYGSGENGHVFNNTDVQIHNGKIGIDADTPTYGTAEITDPVTNITYTGANYPKRGNVYGGGCGEDDYTVSGAKYFNPLAGIVLGNANVTIDGGKVVHNVYGAGALGSVGSAKLTTGGKTIIAISNGQVGDDGDGDGNVYGAARGKVGIAQTNIAQVRETSVTISSTGDVKASVYGGGEAGNVRENTAVSMTGGAVGENVYGGGNLGYVGTFDVVTTATSKEYNFKDIEGNANTPANSDKKNTGVCTVTISGGKVGPDTPTDTKPGNVFGAGKGSAEEFECEPAMVYSTSVLIYDGTVNGTVYGGGEVGRVENNTVVTIGTAGETDGTKKPDIKKNVFAAGKGLNTHGYSALVRGDSKVTVQGKANVEGSVFGGGEIATVGRYVVVDNLPTTNTSGGDCVVEIKDNAHIAEDVYGAGKGVLPYEGYTSSETPWSKTSTGTTEYTDVNKDAYFKYITTLAIVSNTHVTVTGSATVDGSVYGGGQKGFVQTDTDVKIQGSCTIGTTTAGGNVFGGGLGDASVAGFAEAGRVKGNTNLAVSGGNVYGNVYGGGSLGDVGTIVKNADYNYKWTNETNPGETYTYNNTGLCTVEINDGIIGIDDPTDATRHGNVFGAGKGKDDTYWCEKAMVYKTNVTINKGTIKGNVYGGGQIGRVENNAVVTIGPATGNDVADIKGNVFGAGAGLNTHGYSALVRGNATVIVQGKAQVAQSVYGGGETASVGRFVVDLVTSLPTEPLSGGTCTVTVNGDAAITGNVYGACKGVEPDYAHATQHWKNDNQPHAFADEADYLKFLKTLALTSNTDVTIGGKATIGGDVFGGGQRGITLGYVEVDMIGGTVNNDVYGGGALADTNTSNWDGSTLTVKYYEVTGLTAGTSDVTGLYTKSGETYTEATGTAVDGTTYYRVTDTRVNLYGGMIKGDAYGGGLGRRGTNPVEAKVYGDVAVNLGKADRSTATAFWVDKYTEGTHAGIVKSGRVFGCNNLNGSPQCRVTVTVNRTVKGNIERTSETAKAHNKELYENDPENYKTAEGYVAPTYEVATVYGGGNLADKTVGGSTYVIINGCDVSIRDVYGGGNAAEVPATDVLVNGAYEIDEVFGGGNGKDDYKLDGDSEWTPNPGANVNGNTNTLLLGGLIHEAYGGSNQKGTITGSVNINTDDGQPTDCSACALDVEKIVGAGKNADVNGDLIMILGCKPTTKTPLVFAGADNADVNGNVELTITSGTFGQVFGGNNLGGAIKGHIILNIEETGCNPIVIDSLYLGGNQAAYSVYGYNTDGSCITSGTTKAYADPILNVVSCTSIRKVFGGGLGTGAKMYADPTVNINMIKGTATGSLSTLGTIGDVFGGGNAADVYGNTTVNIGMEKKVKLHKSLQADGVTYNWSEEKDVLGANITGNVFGGGNEAKVSGNTYVNICGTQEPDSESENGYKDTSVNHSGTEGFAVSIGNSVYGGGNAADVEGNTFVTMADGYVFNGIFGGGLAGSVGTFTRKYNEDVTDWGHTAHDNPAECIGKPISCAAGTGTCYVVVSGGQIGPIEVATQGMARLDADGGPVPQGWVWGAGCGIVEDPTTHPDTHFKAYVNNTDVTIKDNAFILESIIGGGEFGRVLGNTLVKIKGGQIGVGEGMVDNGKPVRYTDGQFVDPTDPSTTITAGLATCSHFPFGKEVGGKKVYECYDPYTDAYKVAHSGSELYPGGITDGASDGKTWIGCVFAGGSGYMPYVHRDGSGKVTDYDWVSSAGWVEGNAEVRISGGHILTNVYGGNEYTDVKGTSKVIMTGGTVGVPRTKEQIEALPMSGYIYGAGKGDERTHFNTATNVGSAEVEVSGGIVYGSVYGGGEDGHVLGDVKVTIKEGAKIGSCGTSYFDGHVFGGGRGLSGIAQTAGTVGGNVEVNIEGGKMLGSIYGGGRLASVGTQFTAPEDDDYGNFKEDDTNGTYGHVTVNISGGTIGKLFTPDTDGNLPGGAQYSGNVYGGSMGRLTLLNGDTISIWPKMAQVKYSAVNIYGTAEVRRSVYGGGELGTVRDDAYVTIGGYKTGDADTDGDVAITKPSTDNNPIVRRDVYGGGYGSDRRNYTVFTVKELESDNQHHPHTYAFTPMQFAGCVGQNTYVNVAGGYIRKSVYGGGEMASVGVINYRAAELTSGTSTDGKVTIGPIGGKTYYYTNMVKHADPANSFALSWPYKFEYVDGYPGATHVKVTGGRLGLKNGDTDTGFDDNGDVYGAGKGMAGDFKDYLFCANVGSTNVVIDHSSSNNLTAYSGSDDLIAGAVYGGGEDGHVMGNTQVTMSKGFVYHSIYGAGSGKGKYEGRLLKIGASEGSTTESDYYTRSVYSITAGKVFGNSTVEMSGGTVVRNVYGGGNMGSVGKGNYAGGSDDYSTDGYGEKVSSLWSNTDFTSSGKCTVKITGGTIGYIDTTTPSNSMYPFNSPAGLPYGNVFGGCRGEAAPDLDVTPSYHYSPEFFMGYVNETDVQIGKTDGNGPTILGSVYGGGMDGHVRRDASVVIKGGEIGIPYDATNKGTLGTDPNNILWLARGNVYGSGSGIGTYNANNIQYKEGYTGTIVTGTGNSTSAGSVTRFTKVDIQGGTIYRNVYGGGSLSSIGAPKINQTYDEYRKGDTNHSTEVGKQTLNEVVISGGQIGDANSYDASGNHVYGGDVFGGSRGDATLDATKFSTSMFTSVTINANTDETKNPVIEGSVFGGGEVGIVKGSVDVNINGGTVNHDVYGGGALANTNTANVTSGYGTDSEVIGSTSTYKTTVNLLGGLIKGDAYGGGLGRLANAAVTAVAAMVYGDVKVELNNNNNGNTADGEKTGCIVNRIFGCNNLNGTPKGKVQVYVYATQQDGENLKLKDKKALHDGFETGDATTYDVTAVYGGGNLSPYDPVDAYSTDDNTQKAAQTEVYINGCSLTSIKYVYGGGNAAAAPATYVRVNGAYEIEELFAGGNGKDNYVINDEYYVNPGANVGYKNYTHLVGGTDGGDGSKGNPYQCTENDNAKTKADRQTAANGYMYGSGIAHLEVFGGNVHASYGGSNEKGNIRTMAWSKYEEGGDCGLQVAETYGGGKNSEIDGEIKLDLGCTTYMPEIFGGSKNADVFSDIELNIANGRYDRVFGGNNTSGNIHGSITVNIKENGCVPINIKNLYLGGYLAGYSIYGYKDDGTIRTKAEYDALEDKSGITVRKNPRINVISATRIDSIFGGGYQATVVGDPHVNINMEQGRVEVSGKTLKEGTTDVYIYKDGNNTEYASDAYTIENVGEQYYAVLPLGTIGNVYGGGNEADIIGDTYVEIGTGTYHDANGNLVSITPARNAAMITGNVFGGGKGVADSFECEKAMVGVKDKGFGSTHVTIENGTVNGNVYGGGQIGRVEHDTWVTIGKEGDETNNPVVKGDVFGAGKGLKTHGYSALVRGKATVTVQGKAHVEGSVYGGGEIASVGRYNVKKGHNDPEGAPDWVPVGMPYSLYDETSESGNCNVVIRDNAVIGPETPMQMKKTGGPDDTGHVFGAGKGVLPYEGYGVAGDDWASVPWRMAPDNTIDYYSEDKYVKKEDGLDYKAAYLQFIETLALATETNVNISGNAFVKGSVYGGSMNGHVQHHTRVTIAGGQIGAGDGMSEPYKETDWTGKSTPAGGWKECAHWDYVDNGATYDPLATKEGTYDYTNYPFIPETDRLTSSEGGLPTAKDGHTYYGNVFGGGSGVIPYAPGLWHRASGSVGGNSYVTITGGHILTSVYGGNEQTDVGTYTKDDPTVPATGGKCTITMTGGTVGVPLEHKENYPVTGHLFGAGKGDKRILFNTWTNVAETEVNVSGGTIYGNVYGGGEDGHVMSLSKMTISEADATTNPTIIGTTGTSGYDGDVFGGGQGSVTALTAGVVGGNVNLSIEGGIMKGSVYGGGRLASVGTFFALASAANYGRMQDGDDHGNIVVNLTGGTIKQNVFGGCMGSTTDNRLGVSKNVTVNLNGYETTTGETTTTVIVADDKKGCVVKGSVFGCNNLESSPLGDVLVHVYGTQKDGASQIANTAGSGETAAVENAKTPATQVAGEFDLSSFDVKAVYGGGNLAAYKPQGPGANTETYDYENTTKFAKVIIDGCGRTSIGHVYGGGNAASTPATEVTVNGTYEIGELFGGGNGKDDVTIDGVTKPNPGANVGYYNYSIYEKDGDTWKVKDDPNYDTKEKRLNSAIQYGTGKAAVNIFGGTIHRVFGGSNTKGNVRQSAITLLEEAGGCEFCVDEAYGGGKSAPMDAEAKLLMACIPGLKAVYGGAQAADVYDDVSVTVTNGNFDRVFGGNNLSGTIRGKITVNVEETGCRPVIIGELYGGGNQAGYSVYGYNDDGSMIESGETPLYQDPQVNVRSFTSIGNIYGGGYGEGAKMVGNPTVNINVVEGDKKDYTYDNDQSTYKVGEDNVPYYDANGFKELTLTVDGHSVVLPSHTKGKIGAINNVFGGGNAAEVKGNTNVNVGTLAEEYQIRPVAVGNSVANYYTRSGEGTESSPYKYTPATGNAVDGTTYYEKKTVIGADIRGNVYGGGNNAEVTGNTNVTIGQEKKTE